MKKTRFFAALLCIMMSVCSLPMLQVSAANVGVNDPALMSAIANVMGYGVATPATNTADWIALNMDYSNGFIQTDAMTADDDITYDENGINFPTGDSVYTWRYTEQISGKSYSGWSPFCVSGNYSFRFKLEEGGSLENFAPKTWASSTSSTAYRCAHLSVTPDGVTIYDGTTDVPIADRSGFKPGNDWNDVLVVSDTNAYKVYMKKATDNRFALVGGSNIFNEGYGGLTWAKNTNGAWETAGLTFKANGAYVKSAVSAKEYTGTYYDSVEDIAGGPVALTHNFDLNENSSKKMYNYTTGSTGIYYKDGGAAEGTYTADYWTKLIMEKGKFYTWTVKQEKSNPTKEEIATVPTRDDVYYRIETTGGAVRLYADGNIIASYLGVISSGSPQLGVNVKEGEVDYLSVNDYTDIYLYEDNFNGKADFESLDYWRISNNYQPSVNEGLGVLTLNGVGKENIFAELNANAGDVTMSADVSLSQCEGGVWFVMNQSIQEEYTKLGYNVKTGKYELVDVKGDSKGITTNVLKEVEGVPPTSSVIHMEAEMRYTDIGREISLSIDNNKVLEYFVTDRYAPSMHRGRIGFMVSQGLIGIQNFSYRGDAKPLLSVNENDPAKGTNNTYDMLEVGGELFLVNNSSRQSSKDGGKTWTNLPKHELQSTDVVQLAKLGVLY